MSPLDHDDAIGLASVAVEGELTAEQERELAIHLVACPSCKAYYDGLHHARAALRRSDPGEPPPEAVDVAVHRSTTVLLGEADPGPRAHVPAEPGAWGNEETGPMPAVADEPSPWAVDVQEPDARPDDVDAPVEDDRTAAPLAPSWPGPSPDEIPSAFLRDEVEEEPEHVEAEAEPEPGPDDREVPLTAPGAIPEPPVGPVRISSSDPPRTIEPPLMYEPPSEPVVPQEESPFEEPMGPDRSAGPWILAIVATLAVAALAAWLFVSRPAGDAPDLPQASEVQAQVAAAFDDLRSLNANFTMDRLSLYRFREENERIVYSFSQGEFTGQVLFEDPDNLREEVTLEVAQADARRTVRVRTTDTTRTLIEDEDGPVLRTVERYPLGPAAGELHPRLGVLEEAVGLPVRLFLEAADPEVVDRVEIDGRQAYRVRFEVTPTPVTLADRIEITVDAVNGMPIEVRRSIGRSDADVLGPQDLLGESAIDAAFGDRERIVTSSVRLSGVGLGEVNLPSRFTLDIPGGVEEETVDAGFVRVAPAELAEQAGFEPLLPSSLPEGIREEGFAVHTGEPTGWGPEDAYPPPEGIVQSSYTDGHVTIVIEQRKLPEDVDFDASRSPLVGDLPLTTRTFNRDGTTWTFAVSAEAPPHVFGVVDGIFVLVSGHATDGDLLRLASSLEPTAPTDVDDAGEDDSTGPDVVDAP